LKSAPTSPRVRASTRVKSRLRCVGTAFAALLLASLPSVAQPTSPWPEAYARRDFKLGISISDFRQMPHPDQKESPNAFPVCAGDPNAMGYPYESDLEVAADWRTAGVTKCSYFYKSGPSVYEAGIKMGDLNSTTSFYFISGEGGSEPRLFMILSGGPSQTYAELTNIFATALGKPAKVTNEPFQTRAGAIFENEVTVWKNASSQVEIRRFGVTTMVLQVKHTLNSLASLFERRIAESNAAKAKKI
jgi:hypothetical protein